MDIQPQGQIITFYSYKGGTGRSMSLANVACLLAENQNKAKGKGVLMIDWDLEAPGLHRYFQDKLFSRNSSSKDNCDSEPGLIDLFYKLHEEAENLESTREKSTSPQSSGLSGEEAARMIIKNTNIEKYILRTKIEGLSLLKAGCFNAKDTNEYSERVNKFNWEALYQKSPHLLRVFAETLAEEYAYVLIDSRTGITDVSGVCTMLLPEKLVVVFTPNNQSLGGVIDVARRSTEYRKESGDLRPLVVFPLVSRVEANEPELRTDWRFGNKERKITGYQPEFEKVLAEVYNKEKVTLDDYFDKMQIQHIPKYAYGEEVAVLIEKIEDIFSLKRNYRTFANKLVESQLPWEEAIEIAGSSKETKTSSTNFDVPEETKTSLITTVKDYFALNSKESIRLILAIITVVVVLLGIYSFYSAWVNKSAEQESKKLNDALIKSKDDQIKLTEENSNKLNKDLEEIKDKLQKYQSGQTITPSPNSSATPPVGSQAYVSTNTLDLRLRNEPSKNAQQIGSLKIRQKVYVLGYSDNSDTINGKTGNWANIQTEDGKTGWVFSPYITGQNQKAN